ncbi:MAG: hypothetical protein V4563_05060 [Pseudomonadota bacterium]
MQSQLRPFNDEQPHAQQCYSVPAAEFVSGTHQTQTNKWTLSDEKISNRDHLTGLGFDQQIVDAMLRDSEHRNWVLCTPQEIRRQARHHANKLADEGFGSYGDPEMMSLPDVDKLSEPLPIPEFVIDRILRAVAAAVDEDIEAASFIATHATQSPPPHPPTRGCILHACLTPKILISPTASLRAA